MLPSFIVRQINQLLAQSQTGRTMHVQTKHSAFELVEARLSHFGAVVLHYHRAGQHGMYIVPHWQFFHSMSQLEAGQPILLGSNCGATIALWTAQDESPISFSSVRALLAERARNSPADSFLASHPLSEMWPTLSRDQVSTLAWTYSPEKVANLAGVTEREVQTRYSRLRIDPPGECYWRRVDLAYIAHPMGVAQPRQSTRAIKPMRAPESAWVLHA